LLATGCSAAEETEPVEDRQLVQEVYLAAYQHEFEPKVIEVKSLTPVKLMVSSFDDDYYIEIPGLDIDVTQIRPQETAVLSFTAVSEGSFEFRNPLDSAMTGTLVVKVCPPAAIQRPNPIPSDAASIATGREIYASNCLSCHGVAGKGDGPAVKGLTMKPIDLTQPYMANISDGEMFWVMEQGLGEMPSFRNRLSDDMRWHVINYIRSLSQEKPF
jgi:mono/diheme cytochrome c family protein